MGSQTQYLMETGMLSAKSRKKIKNSERRDYYKIVHREWDKKSAAQSVKETIEIALGNPLLADMTGTVY